MTMSCSTWPFFRVALLATGKGEAQFLPTLFRSLVAEGHCTFKVACKIEQQRPITSVKRIEKMVRTGKQLTSRDENIGLLARNLLRGKFDYVILVDDLEHDFRDQAQDVFRRYRDALDTMLHPVGLSARASVHFLVNMLEAYYFAHADAINGVLGTELGDSEVDVESIRHPKNELKRLSPGFDEVEHGGLILERLDVAQVLSNPATCRSLRTLFAWCSKAIGREFTDVYRLRDGSYFEVTRPQIDALPDPPPV
jgi:uncharacterized protein DUF4276